MKRIGRRVATVTTSHTVELTGNDIIRLLRGVEEDVPDHAEVSVYVGSAMGGMSNDIDKDTPVIVTWTIRDVDQEDL